MLANPGFTANGDAIHDIFFEVSREGKTVYTKVENNARYCLFGGTESCNNWPKTNSIYTWGEGGPPVEPGKYFVNIAARDADKNILATWSAPFSMRCP